MAKARMKIICANCGAEFAHTRDCWNATDREDYIAWAEQNITLCPSCWGRQEAKRVITEAVESGNATIERMPYRDYKHEWAFCRTMPDTYDAETKTIEVCISKIDRAWHDILPEIPDELKKDEISRDSVEMCFRRLMADGSLTTAGDSPEWAAKVAEMCQPVLWMSRRRKWRRNTY